MSVVDIFSAFLANLAIDNVATISERYGEITAAIEQGISRY